MNNGRSGEPEQALLQIWNDIQSELATITKTETRIVKHFLDFFLSGKYDTKNLVNTIAEDAIDGIIDSLETLADILFKSVSVGISMTRSIANKEINIPVIGWLWKTIIAKGRPLTLLSLCALLIAIPTTVLYKVKKKVAPPKLAGRLTKDSFHQYVNGQGDTGLAGDIAFFNLASSSSLESVFGEFETLALFADGAFEGSGLETIPVGFLADLMNVVDSATLTFQTMETFTSWPVTEKAPGTMAASNFDLKTFCMYSVRKPSISYLCSVVE